MAKKENRHAEHFDKLSASLVSASANIEAPYELPVGWKWTRLGDCATYINGRAFKPEEWETQGKPIIRIQNLTNTSDSVNRTTKQFEEKYLIKNNDLLYAWSASLGAHIWHDEDGWLNQHIFKVVPNDQISKMYLYYSLVRVTDNLYAKAHGSGMVHVTLKPFLNTTIPLPPTLAEQQRIVNRIETMFAKLDQAQEKAQAVLDSFETRKAAILHKAFTGQLTANWRKKNEVEKNEELESIYSFVQSLPKKDITNIVEFQKQASDYILSDGTLWKKCFIGAIGIVTNGSTPSRKEPAFWNGDIPWVSSGEVSNNIIEATNERITEEGYNNSSVKKLPIGTVLIAMIGEGKTRGQTSVLNIEATTNQNIAAILINHGRVEPKFLWYWLQKEYKNNRTAGNGSGPQALNCQRVRELPFILPTLTEQQEIVHILETVLEKESRAKEATQNVLDQIALLKKSILARAFRGKI